MAQPKPIRRRIVPEQIFSPTRNQEAVPESEATAANHHKIDIGDLKEHSELASTLLGPGRKLYVDLASYQRQGKAIDWKELLVTQQNRDEGGEGLADVVHGAEPREGGGKEPERGRLDSPGAPRNPLAAVIRRLERTIGMARFGEEEFGEDNNELEGQDSGAEAEAEAEVDGGEEQEQEQEQEQDQEVVKEASQRPKSSKTRKKNEYDYIDDWIDDSEFIEMIEHTDRRKLKYEGFFIAKGDVERLEELVPDAVPDKATSKDPNRAKKKRQRSGPELEEQGIPAAGEEQRDGNSKRKKTTSGKKKTQNGSIGPEGTTQEGLTASQAPSSGPPIVPTMTSTPSKQAADLSGQTPKEGKTKSLYTIPPHVSAKILEMRSVAAKLPPPPSPPPAPSTDGDKVRKSKKLPPEILALLKAAESAFHKEVDEHGSLATKRIVDELMSFLEPYSTRENMRLYVSRRPARSGTRSAPAAATLGESIAHHYQSLSSPGPRPQQLSEELEKKVVAFIESRVTQSAKNTPPEVSQGTSDLPGSVLPLILKEVVDLFPPSAEITPESLLALLRKWGKKAKMPGPPTGKTWTDVEVVEILDSAEGSQGPEQGIPNIPKSQPLAARAIAAALAAAQKR